MKYALPLHNNACDICAYEIDFHESVLWTKVSGEFKLQDCRSKERKENEEEKDKLVEKDKTNCSL